MTDAELYPRLTALGLRVIRDDPKSLPGVDYRQIEAAMKRLSWTLFRRWEKWADGNTCGMNGPYADDVELFLEGLPNND